MTRDDFIRQQDIVYLNPIIFTCILKIKHIIWMTKCPCENSQLQTMVSLSDNGAISMDATFNTNDVKFHLFTLMVFDAHCTRMPIAWIITSCQTCDDVLEWLIPLKTKLQRKNPKWKPSCFIVDDAPQELQAL